MYFPDKKAIFVELIDEFAAQVAALGKDAVRGLDSRIDVERAALRSFLWFAAKHKNLYRIIRQAEFVDPAAFQSYYRTIAEPYARGLSSAMRKDKIRTANPETLAFLLMGVADFAGMRYVLWGKHGEDLETVLDEAIDFIARGIQK